MQPLLAISMGDPAGIGPEVILKAATVKHVREQASIVVFGDPLVLERASQDNGVPMRIAELTRADMTEALTRGWAARDSRVPMLLQEERAGVNIKVPAADIEAVIKRDG